MLSHFSMTTPYSKYSVDSVYCRQVEKNGWSTKKAYYYGDVIQLSVTVGPNSKTNYPSHITETAPYPSTALAFLNDSVAEGLHWWKHALLFGLPLAQLQVWLKSWRNLALFCMTLFGNLKNTGIFNINNFWQPAMVQAEHRSRGTGVLHAF
jgi:hypothetical protein